MSRKSNRRKQREKQQNDALHADIVELKDEELVEEQGITASKDDALDVSLASRIDKPNDLFHGYRLDLDSIAESDYTNLALLVLAVVATTALALNGA